MSEWGNWGQPGGPGQEGTGGTGGAGGTGGTGRRGRRGLTGETGARGRTGPHRPAWKSVVPYVALVVALTIVVASVLHTLDAVKQESRAREDALSRESEARGLALCEASRENRRSSRNNSVLIVTLSAWRPRIEAEAQASEKVTHEYVRRTFEELTDLDCSKDPPVKVPLTPPPLPPSPACPVEPDDRWPARRTPWPAPSSPAAAAVTPAGSTPAVASSTLTAS